MYDIRYILIKVYSQKIVKMLLLSYLVYEHHKFLKFLSQYNNYLNAIININNIVVYVYDTYLCMHL